MRKMGAEHENLDQKAYLILKKMIIERKLLPGEKIPQEKLADELGISRTPLISALKYLEQEKLVTTKPRRGFFVRLFNRQEMVCIFELREVLEGLAARRAARHITQRQIKKLKNFFHDFDQSEKIKDYKRYSQEDRLFHNFVIGVGAKEFLKGILENTNIISYSYQVVSFEGLIRPPRETLREHLDIITAISSKDSAAAESLMRKHLSKTIAALENDPMTMNK